MPITVPEALATLALGMALAGCGVQPAPRIASTQGQAAAPAPVRVEPQDRQDPVQQRFAAALAGALARHGFSIRPDSPEAVIVALAQRPAAMGVTQASQPPVPPADWLSLPRRGSLLDGCKPQRIDARVTRQRDDQATPAFAARGGFDFCRADPRHVDDLAGQFAAALAGH